jgi:tRNA (guanine-N7-)-methyltransferase
MTRKYFHLSEEEKAALIIQLYNNSIQISLAEVFGNSNPVEIEIGFGKGAFLVEQSSSNPNKNYLGIEKEKKYCYYTALRLSKRKVTNCKLLIADASKLMAKFIPSNCIETIHAYFPDPWWKNRHHKRRIISQDFLKSITRTLAPGGKFKLATDVSDYYFRTLNLIELTSSLCLVLAKHEISRPANSSMTNFEKKAFDQGNSVYRLESFKSHLITETIKEN